MLIYKQQDNTKVTLGEKEMNSKVFELNNLLSELDGQGGYFIDLINTRVYRQVSYDYILVKMTAKNHIQLMRCIMLLRAMALSN